MKMTQLIIIFIDEKEEFIKVQYDKTDKSLNRFFALTFYCNFKTKNKSLENYNLNFKRIDDKRKSKAIINDYFRKLYIGF